MPALARSILAALAAAAISSASAERINHEGRLLGELPSVTAPLLFNTPAADAVVSAMQIMPVDSAWNEDVSRRPVLANSDAMIAQVKSDLSASRQTLRPFYEMNYVLVPDAQPRVTIPFFNYADESDLDGGTFPAGRYPIPANLPIETWPRGTGSLTLQQWQQDVNNTGGDRHAIMVAPGVGAIWETWLTRLTSSGWQASNGAKFDLNTNAMRPAGWTSADAAGLPMFPAIVRYDECARGIVEHALRLVVAKSRCEYIYPARHYASSIPATSTNYPAMGQRFRLKASFAIPESWTTQEKAVLRALKKYGAVVADNGNFFSISVAPDDRFAANAFDHLATIDINNFEVIQTTGPTEGPRATGAPTVNAGRDLLTEVGETVALAGAVNDPTGTATVQWRTYSGPGAMSFANPQQPATTASFDAPGVYTLMLSADDRVHAVAYDAVVVRVTARDAMANISTRLLAGTGDDAAIGGFIIGGDQPKQVVVRAIGPSLAAVGVAGPLDDPTLQLFDSAGGAVGTNDNWRDTQEAQIEQTHLSPADDRESAIVVTLAPGAYTAVVAGKQNYGGVALVEAYDMQPSASSKLGNISTRGFVSTGNNVMIGGTIITGPDTGRVLFRALGPSLASAGVSNALSNPQLELFNADGAQLASNDDWQSARDAVSATGLPPTSDSEAALVADLPPGGYTAVVSGVHGATGVALVEAYHLQ
jgi:hypothetical protein